MPQIQYQSGGLIGAEFWRLPDYAHNIPLTLSKTEAGQHRDFEMISKPRAVLSELHQPQPKMRPPSGLYKTQFFETRRKQIETTTSELVSHEPEFDELQVCSYDCCRRHRRQVVGRSISRAGLAKHSEEKDEKEFERVRSAVQQLRIEEETDEVLVAESDTAIPLLQVSWLGRSFFFPLF